MIKLDKNLKISLRFLLKEKYKFTELQILNVNENLNRKILNDIKKLNNGYPVDYLIGYKYFLNCKIDLSKKPLIPRTETEYWVENEIKNIPNRKMNILDMYAGSGCVGIAILKNTKNTNVTFVDIKRNFIEQIKINLYINKINSRYKLIKSNRFKNIKTKFNIIFANPPYVASNFHNKNLKFEPKIALFSKDNGLYEICNFLKEAYNFLLPEGYIVMEFGFGQKKYIDKYLKSLKIYIKWEFYKDQFGKYRYLKVYNNNYE